MRALRHLVGAALIAAVGIPVLSASPAVANVPGYQVSIIPTELHGSEGTKTATARCSPGRKVVSAQYALTGPGERDVRVTKVTPSQDLTQVFVEAVEVEGGTTQNWGVDAVAVCANPITGQHRVDSEFPFSSQNRRTSVAECPAGERVLGVGYTTVGALGEVSIEALVPGFEQVTVRAIEDETLTSGNWAVQAHAICGAPLPQLFISTATSTLDSTPSRKADSPCAGISVPLAAGGEIVSGGFGQTFFDSIDVRNLANGDIGRATALEDKTGNPSNWQLKSYAICARI